MLVWLPFIAAGRPGQLPAATSRTYQDDIFNVLSLPALEPVVGGPGQLGAGGEFVLDSTPVLGPITFRHIGFGLAGILALAVFAGRVPAARAPQGLALGLAAITLVAFVSLTTMHERYAYPAFVFLLWRRTHGCSLTAWAVFAVAFARQPGVRRPARSWRCPTRRGSSASWGRRSSRWSR